MMEGWQACFFVLFLDLAFGRDIQVNNTSYVVKKTDTCPDVGYFFRRDPSPNVIAPGPCFLCFCQDNGTAFCWERESRRCDVEKFHHHRVGRHSRFRRAARGALRDIFLRDASRDFFKKKLPEECKPFDSFSDGCPPVDWCIGCTVCDCDANGHWDCHILSFCDGKGRKKSVKPGKGVSAKKKLVKRRTSQQTTTTRKTTTRPKTPVKKSPQGKAKPQDKARNKTNFNANKPPTRLQAKKHMKKKLQLRRQRQSPKSNVSNVKVIKKDVATRKPVTLQGGNKKKKVEINPNNDTVKLGQKIVKQVMTAVQKLLKKEINKINGTRVQRSINSCGAVKKRDKRTYNVMSNAAARNKTKYKRQVNVKENYTYSRFKREILNETQAETQNVTVIKLLPDTNAVIPLENMKQKNNTLNDSLAEMTVAPISTPQLDDYYKYTATDYINETTPTEAINNVTDRYENDVFINFIVPVEPTHTHNNVSNNTVESKTTAAVNPDFNDLKFTKWYIVKNKKDKQKKAITRLILPKPSVNQIFKDVKLSTTEQSKYKDILPNKDVIYEIFKKQNSTKLNFVTKNTRRMAYTKTVSIKNKTDVTGLQNVLQNILMQLNSNNTARLRPKPSVSIMKYVRRFFQKIFSKKKTGSNKVYGIGAKEDHTLQLLCENIGPCKINRRNRFILKYKLKQLNEETGTIIRSIKIIKGLLHLLDLPQCNKRLDLNKSNAFKNDLQKLSVVLRDNYNIEEMNVSLTDTQIGQINYIKKNTQTFIESVKKFADLLNETIAIIRPNFENDLYSVNLPKKQHNTMPFRKIKKMLYKYNLIQNTFMRRMYELISGVENKTTTTTTENNLDRNSKTQASNLKEVRNDKVIEIYSRNMIKKLRRLRTLAQALSSKRKKRSSVIKSDAVEYLLTLMEYLIKQNHHLDSVPANDGIDFLIDAIKNAPEIKPIKKKVLDYAPLFVYNDVSSADVDISNPRIDDSISESNPRSKEENQTNIEDNIILDDNSDQMEQTTEAIKDNPKIYYRHFNVKPEFNEILFDSSTAFNRMTKKHMQVTTEKTGFDKFESNIDEIKKFDVDTGDTEDDTLGDSTSNIFLEVVNNTLTNVIEEPTTISTNVSVTTIRANIQSVQSNETSSESQDSRSDSKKTKLDWIEETFDREIREFSDLNASYPSPKPSSAHPTLTSSTTEKNKENLSSLTEEIDGIERGTKKLKKTDHLDVMHQKQIEFLNSLDYGTERSNAEEADSKDDNKSDDAFPSYFLK